MTSRRLVYSQAAQNQLDEIWAYIAAATAPGVANDYVTAILDHCDGLVAFPFRGTEREDIRPGLRIIGFRRRAVVAFAVSASRVDILGVYYGGRDYEVILSDAGPSA